MKKSIKKFMLFLFLFISSLSFAEIRFKDDVGREIVLEKPLTKVVVASRYNNELIRAIGSIKNVISVDDNTAQDRVYWKDFDPKNSIGKGQNSLNYEKIIELAPEALVTPRNSSYEKDIEQLSKAGIKVIVVTGWDNAHMPEQIERLGKIFGNEKGAKKLIEFYNKNLNEVKKRVAKVKNKKTIYWEYGEPYTTAIPGTSNDGWVNMMRVAGGINIFDDPTIKGKTIDPEKILLEDPDLIIKTTSGAAYKNTGVYTAPSQEECKNIMNEMINRSGWKDLKAVKSKNVYITTGFCAGGLGKLIGVIYTAKWLYPEEMKDINHDKVFEEWMAMQGVKAPKGHVYKLK